LPSKPDHLEVRFFGALLAGIFVVAIAIWAIESGHRFLAITAVLVFVIVWAFATLTWLFWLQDRAEAKRAKGHDD
jgi:hypothetical protein